MSGGSLNYLSYHFDDLFNYTPHYGEEGHKLSQKARKFNPMEDKEVSELVWDVACLLHSLEWYQSSDISEEKYREDLQWFKNKWLGVTGNDVVERYKQDLKDSFERILKEMG